MVGELAITAITSQAKIGGNGHGESRHGICPMVIMTEEKTNIPPNNVRAIRKAQKKTLEKVAEAVGTDARTLQRIETQEMRLSDKWIFPIARALGVAPGALLVNEDEVVQGAPLVRNEVRPASIDLPPTTAMPNDVPVMGTAAGSHVGGAFQFEGGVVDYVRRPPALMGAMKAYALYVEGTSMVPEHNPGDLRFVHPDRPPRMGDSVVVQIQMHKNAPIEATIGRLQGRNEKMVVIGKLNPEARVELKRETVVAVHKVLTINDLFGV